MTDHGKELAARIREAEETIKELGGRARLTKAEARRLELAYALRDHRRKMSERELRAKIIAGWR